MAMIATQIFAADTAHKAPLRHVHPDLGLAVAGAGVIGRKLSRPLDHLVGHRLAPAFNDDVCARQAPHV